MTVPDERGDAELVAGLRAGDQGCLAAVYDRYGDRLHDFCLGMLRDRDDAADAVQDTFVLVARRIGQLRDPERLRPWLYAVARSVALDRARARARTLPTDTVMDTADPTAGPERLAEQEALRRLVADASEGLSDGDRAMLRLHLHGLEGAELGEALGIGASTAHVRLSRLRDQVERSLGALLVARLGSKECPDLAGVLGEWEGRFTPLLRKRVARHVDGCDRCGDRRRAVASPWALLSGVVVLPAPAQLRDRVLGDVRLVGWSGGDEPDGAGSDGAGSDGAGSDGAGSDGAGSDGAGSDGAGSDGAGSDGAGSDGAGSDGAGSDGAGSDGAGSDGTGSDGTGSDGIGPDRAAGPGGADVPAAVAAQLAVRRSGRLPVIAAAVVAAALVVAAVVLAAPRPVPDSAPAVALAPVTPDPTTVATAVAAPTAAGTAEGAVPGVPTTGGAVVRPDPPAPAAGSAVNPVADPPVDADPLDDPGAESDAPRITGAAASPARIGVVGCAPDRAAVRVTLAEETPATGVVLGWSGPAGSGSVPMRGSGSAWSGELGPFRTAGTVTWSVTASNAAGSTTGAPATVAVSECAPSR